MKSALGLALRPLDRRSRIGGESNARFHSLGGVFSLVGWERRDGLTFFSSSTAELRNLSCEGSLT